jgi:polar amino acid transport system ATP-binding protein
MEMLCLSGLCKSFGHNEVLKGVDLTVGKGEAVVLIGASGSGKSTLLRCINGLETPTGGQLAIEGVAVGGTKGESRQSSSIYREVDFIAIRRRVGMVFQQFNLFPHMTALENVMEGPRTVLRLPRSQCRQRALLLLARVGLEEKAAAYPASLSGGQQQRVAIARALAMEPQIMLFDEPTSALDPELVGEVLDTMHGLAQEGMTMVIVTHELGFAYSVASRVVFLHDGRILEEGSPREVLLQPQEERTRLFIKGHGRYRLPERADSA